MKLRLLILFVFTLFASSSFGQTDKKAFEYQIQEMADILQLPGYSLAVVKDGKVIYRKMAGYSNLEKKIPVSEDDLFMIASVTKTFTANLLMQYEQERKASLEDYVLNYRFIDIGFGWPYNVDPNLKIKQVLSQTSEDGPGSSFVYNGSRFNYIYGVFEAAGGHSTETDAYQLELQKRVLDPLNMNHTIFGFPKSRRDTMFRYIATPYIYDKATKCFTEDTVNYAHWTRAFPSGGLLSTIGDLVKYTNSYDHHTLISAASYAKVTSPTVLNDGSLSPYGLGWFTETFAGKKIHWHYGQADSYASLFIRVPETGYTFIFLANSNAPSEAIRLGAGQIWESPFALAFLKYFVFANDQKALSQLVPEEAIGRALFLRYTENRAGIHKGEAAGIVAALTKTASKKFERYDPGLIYLLTDLNIPAFHPLVEKLATAFKTYDHVQPYVMSDLANYYLLTGKPDKALELYKKLADARGFEFWGLSADACRKAGQILKQQGEVTASHSYYWKSINDLKLQLADDQTIRTMICEMNAKE